MKGFLSPKKVTPAGLQSPGVCRDFINVCGESIACPL